MVLKKETTLVFMVTILNNLDMEYLTVETIYNWEYNLDIIKKLVVK